MKLSTAPRFACAFAALLLAATLTSAAERSQSFDADPNWDARNNRIVPKSLAEKLAPVFTEVVVAPGYEPDALAVLTAAHPAART